MDTLWIALLSFVGFIVAYRTYGRWLGQKIFSLNSSEPTPAHELQDGVDYVPTRKMVLFGHHFTSIAGTGPIVGPAIAVFWGWLPALIWVVFGSIFIGAVHDFGSLVVSLKNKGQSIGVIAGKVISPRARLLILLVLLLELTIVLAIFGLVIAVIFKVYPGSIPAVWISLPLAIGVGLVGRKTKSGLGFMLSSLIALGVIYAAIWFGVNAGKFDILYSLGLKHVTNPTIQPYLNAVVVWTAVLFVYCFIASVMPVWLLLQPRDYINSLQLYLAMGLLIVGLGAAAVSGQCSMSHSAPAISRNVPADAPPLMPFLFITIACGAVSGFHSLVSSGTSSKQINRLSDAQAIGYGSMLLEGALAVLVILACCAGLGMGIQTPTADPNDGPALTHSMDAEGQKITGQAAWREKYPLSVKVAVKDEAGHETIKETGSWNQMGLDKKVGAFVEGGANFLHAIGLPLHIGVGILGVMVACFAATTLDTATRLQRYVLHEFGETVKLKPLKNKYVATGVAVLGGLGLAVFAGNVPGAGGMRLWPLFGSINQMLAGLGFLVITLYLIHKNKPVWMMAIPGVLMIGLPAWAMGDRMVVWLENESWLLFSFAAAAQLLNVWLVVEAVIAWRTAKQKAT